MEAEARTLQSEEAPRRKVILTVAVGLLAVGVIQLAAFDQNAYAEGNATPPPVHIPYTPTPHRGDATATPTPNIVYLPVIE